MGVASHGGAMNPEAIAFSTQEISFLYRILKDNPTLTESAGLSAFEKIQKSIYGVLSLSEIEELCSSVPGKEQQ
jgi:hypothetical protein